MLFLAFAVLFGSVHVTPWSHEHADAHEHSHQANHDNHHDAKLEVGSNKDQPTKEADVSGDIGHQHSIPAGIEALGSDLDASHVKRQSVSSVSLVTIPASHSRAPPTQPPLA